MPFERICAEVIARVLDLAKRPNRPEPLLALDRTIAEEKDPARIEEMRLELRRLESEWIEAEINALPPDGPGGILCRRRHQCDSRSCSFAPR